MTGTFRSETSETDTFILPKGPVGLQLWLEPTKGPLIVDGTRIEVGQAILATCEEDADGAVIWRLTIRRYRPGGSGA